MENRFLLRKNTGDQALTESELNDAFRKGQFRPADPLYDYSRKQWVRAGDHPALASFFSEKPAAPPERRLIYFVPAGASSPIGPFTAKEIQGRALAKEICASTWVFVEGDKEWRQVSHVKVLLDMLAALPTDTPPESAVAEAPGLIPSGAGREATLTPPAAEVPSISLEIETGSTPTLGGATAPAPVAAPAATVPPMPAVEEAEEITMAFDTMGLNLHSENVIPPPAPKVKPPVPPPPAPAVPKPPEPARIVGKEAETFDGLVAEIPTDPIWLVKQANSETVSGPFRFLEVIKFLEEGRLNKNDKISRTGHKAFTKIGQQYEFNVKFSLETVVENGVEKQKIMIRRRHPRVPYITGVQITGKQGTLAGNCVNISAGGILMEVPKADFNLGEIIEIKILPGLITKPIACKALVIGKIPKIPPGFALKFENLKNDDKESIEFFVQETLKREKFKN